MSPFRSRKQITKFAIMEREGELPRGTTDRWMKETPNPRKLPQRVSQTPRRSKRST